MEAKLKELSTAVAQLSLNPMVPAAARAALGSVLALAGQLVVRVTELEREVSKLKGGGNG